VFKHLYFLLLLLMISNTVMAKEIVRLTSGYWPPYLSQELHQDGFASHVVTESFRAVNIDVVFGYFPWKRSFQYAKNGTDGNGTVWHASLVWVHTLERAKDFTFSDIVISDEETLFYLKSEPVLGGTPEALKGKTIGGTKYTVYPVYEAAEQQGLLTIERAGSYKILFKRLLKGRIDAVPQAKQVGLYLLRTSLSQQQRDEIGYLPKTIQTRHYRLIFSKKIADNQRLVALFNQGLAIIKRNGKYDAMRSSLSLGLYDQPISR